MCVYVRHLARAKDSRSAVYVTPAAHTTATEPQESANAMCSCALLMIVCAVRSRFCVEPANTMLCSMLTTH